ncbi:MAG: sulfatase-like hydrolase/transferase [Deltaproteobacteria bacterium]|nr:sulfatase-like hydrolase/transferase [Deltaproteobacteria bacterium]
MRDYFTDVVSGLTATVTCLLTGLSFILSVSGCGEKLEPVVEHDGGGSSSPNIVIIFADDQGYADVGYHNATDDIRTPVIDSLATTGVRMTNGYVTAPQCSPSRAALMTGMYQQRYGYDRNEFGPLPEGIPTVAQYFRQVGYRTGMVGKWHLDVTANCDDWYAANVTEEIAADKNQLNELRQRYWPSSRGFDDCFAGYTDSFVANFDPDSGVSFPVRMVKATRERVSLVSQAAATFIKSNSDEPFFLYVAPYAPHVPLEATADHLARFPSDMPERRRYALAMIAAIDDGVAQIVETLKDEGIYDNTLIVYMSDNGAPLGIDMDDVPITDDSGIWNGSMNTPMNGEKGMITEGGVHIPFLIHWPGGVPAGKIIDEPVSSLDAVYTALKIAGVSPDILAQLDGIDLMPAILHDETYLGERPLFWRFSKQSAIRVGNWKYLRTSAQNAYLFYMTQPELASKNVIEMNPTLAGQLDELLTSWESTLMRENEPGTTEPENYTWYLTAPK